MGDLGVCLSVVVLQIEDDRTVSGISDFDLRHLWITVNTTPA
jgi:hypothetical protein